MDRRPHRHEPELRDGFVRELARVRKTVRGPKPARALRELGLRPDIEAEAPTTDAGNAASAARTSSANASRALPSDMLTLRPSKSSP